VSQEKKLKKKIEKRKLGCKFLLTPQFSWDNLKNSSQEATEGLHPNHGDANHVAN
jgi:hypothetical protein